MGRFFNQNGNTLENSFFLQPVSDSFFRRRVDEEFTIGPLADEHQARNDFNVELTGQGFVIIDVDTCKIDFIIDFHG